MPPHRPSVFWIYGLSGSGKTTLTTCVSSTLKQMNIPALSLDGDTFRKGLSKDLGFTSVDRMENIRRAAEVAKLICEQDQVVLAAFMTPEAEMRTLAKSIIAPLPFYEIFLDCDVGTCAQRDVKGLYAKLAKNAITNLPGKDVKFESPEKPDLAVDTQRLSLDQSREIVLRFIAERLVHLRC